MPGPPPFDGHQPAANVRFAIDAHIQVHRMRTNSGAAPREPLKAEYGIKDSAFSDRIRKPSELGGMAQDVERLGFAEAGTVTRLARQMNLLKDQWTVDASWWPRLRDQYGVGTEAWAPTTVNPPTVLVVAEAFGAYHQHLLQRPPNPGAVHSPSGRHVLAARQLLEELCWLATGPFGVAHDAHRLISLLAPLSPATVIDFISEGVVTTQVIRALDRSLRTATWNSNAKQLYLDLLSQRPEEERKIYRRTNWIRALRRARLVSRGSNEQERAWVLKGLHKAMLGEGSYGGARATDRRYAFWCLAELTRDGPLWARVLQDAAADDEVRGLLDYVDGLRAYVGPGPVRRDAFGFTPQDDWSGPYLRHGLRELLHHDAVRDRGYVGKAWWAWASSARPSLRVRAVARLRDALFNPDVIRQRTAIDVFRAAGPEVAESVSRTLVAVLEVIDDQGKFPQFVRERCLTYLGMMGRRSALRPVQDALEVTKDATLVQAIATAGDLAYRHPAESPGLQGWVRQKVLDNAADEDVVLAGIVATVASGKHPRVELRDALDRRTEAVESALAWADRVRADPRATRR